jgi:hypothetical protein
LQRRAHKRIVDVATAGLRPDVTATIVAFDSELAAKRDVSLTLWRGDWLDLYSRVRILSELHVFEIGMEGP